MIRLGGRRRPEEQVGSKYYIRNKAKLLRQHRSLTTVLQEIAATRYEADFIAAVVRESLAEFEKLIPELPYIGGDRNPLTGNLVSSASALVFYRVMKQHGKNVEETGELLYQIIEAWIRRWDTAISRWGAESKICPENGSGWGKTLTFDPVLGLRWGQDLGLTFRQTRSTQWVDFLISNTFALGHR